MFQRFLKIIALAYICQLTKFGGLINCGSRDIVKNASCLSTNTRHDVADFVGLGIVKNTKTWISWERNITFLRNKKILNLRLRWHILRSYCFVVQVTFNSFFSKQCSSKNDSKRPAQLHFPIDKHLSTVKFVNTH